MAKPLTLTQKAGFFAGHVSFQAINTLLKVMPYETRVTKGGRFWAWLIDRFTSARKRALRNLGKIYPDMPAAEKARIVDQVLEASGRMIVEQADMQGFAKRRFTLTGDGLPAVLNAEGGFVLVSGHVGNWDAIRMGLLKEKGISIALVYRPMDNSYVNARYTRAIATSGGPIFPKGRGAGRKMREHISSGGPAMIVPDQKQTGAPILEFLGHPAETALTPAKIARELGVPLIPVVSLRDENGTDFTVRFEHPIEVGDDDLVTMQRVNDQICAWIEERRGDWFWVHRRWR